MQFADRLLDGRIRIASEIPAGAAIVADDPAGLRAGRAAKRSTQRSKAGESRSARYQAQSRPLPADLSRAQPPARHRAGDGRHLSRPDRGIARIAACRQGRRLGRGRRHARAVRRGVTSARRHARNHRRAMGRRRGRCGRLSECRSAASRNQTAPDGRRLADRPPRRSAADRRGTADHPQSLRGGRRSRRRPLDRRADQTWA